MDDTSEAGIVYPSGTRGSSLVFSGVRVAQSFILCVVFCIDYSYVFFPFTLFGAVVVVIV